MRLLVSLGLTLCFFLLYWLTLCPTVFWYDSAEYATAASVLGIPHPPGYPLYTLIGHLFSLIPPEPAYGLNLMSALFGAASVGLLCAVGLEIGISLPAACCGAATLGASRVFWNQAIIAEVYTPALALALLVTLLLLRAQRRDSLRLALMAGVLAGLGLGIHLFVATCGLGWGVLLAARGLKVQRIGELGLLFKGPRLLRRLASSLGALLAAAAAGGLIFLYIPWRAAMNPPLNFENPSTWERFSWFVTGGNYKGWFVSDYDFWDRAAKVLATLYDQLLLVGLLLAAAGLIFGLLRKPLATLTAALMAAGNLWFFFNYHVHDLEVFFLPAVTMLALLVGLGAEGIWQGIDGISQRQGSRMLVRVVLLTLPASLVLANYNAVNLRGYTAARDYGEALCAQLPRNAVILNFTTPPEWKSDAVFSNYVQIVQGKRRDVSVLTHNTPARVIQLLQQGLPVFVYHPVPQLVDLFAVQKEGVLYRVLGPLRDPFGKDPGKS